MKTSNRPNPVLVEIRDMIKYYPIQRGILKRQMGEIRAVDGISLKIHKGETLGLVGESGCGKSTAALTLLQLEPITSGQIFFQGQELTGQHKKVLRKLSKEMQMIFQDPYSSLNPRMTVGEIIQEPLNIHQIGTLHDRRSRANELLSMVGLNTTHFDRYPHEFSGGQRQRIGIARALATEPKFIVADEPISALDVSIQAQVVNLLEDLKSELGLTYLFIAHDLSMVRYISDRMAVMYLGRIVEIGNSKSVYNHPLHPYTQALLSGAPIADPDKEDERNQIVLEGDVPSPASPPKGCHFHPRCLYATTLCQQSDPELRLISHNNEERMVACHHAETILP